MAALSASGNIFQFQSINTIINLLYKWQYNTEIECLLEPNVNDSKFKKTVTILVSGFIRELSSTTTPSVLKSIIETYAQVSVAKYEIDYCEGESMTSAIFVVTKIIDKIYENHLGYGKYNFTNDFQSKNDMWADDDEPYCIRARAVLTGGIKCKYSKVLSFTSTSSMVRDIGYICQYDYGAMFKDLWDSNVELKGNDKMNLKQWISLWKSRNIQCSDYDLRRVYYHLGGMNSNTGTGYLQKETVRKFAVYDIYDDENSNYFISHEWETFREKIQKCAQYDLKDYQLY